MKTLKITLGIIVLLSASAFTVLESVNWKVQEGYTVKFSGHKVEGVFTGLKASILFDEANPGSSKISASIDATTANTGNGMKNKHAKGEDALNVNKYPAISFESSSIAKTPGGYEATGTLNLKGVTREIKLPFTFVSQVFSGSFKLHPKDYGITKGGTPDEITIELNVPVSK